MKIYESAENYLETILMLTKKSSSVRSIDIVNEMNVTKPSVSVAMKQLRENGYITMDENSLITLTQKGKDIADKIYKKHILLQKVFVALGVDEKIAIADACKIEHDLSDETIECIKKYYEEHLKK